MNLIGDTPVAASPAQDLDLLIFTTGIFAAPQREQTAEGLERDMAVSFLNRRAMLNTMAPRMLRQAGNLPARPRIFIMGFTAPMVIWSSNFLPQAPTRAATSTAGTLPTGWALRSKW